MACGTHPIYLMSLLWLIVNSHNGEVWVAAANFLVFNTHSIFVSNYISASYSAFVFSVQSTDEKIHYSNDLDWVLPFPIMHTEVLPIHRSF